MNVNIDLTAEERLVVLLDLEQGLAWSSHRKAHGLPRGPHEDKLDQIRGDLMRRIHQTREHGPLAEG